ncbi:maternal protein tudor isoform X2 [Cephus cinctus]|uniref:Maternal protein tudor isoform X2 n=1 Tax=Cephus cinctus TaxID=211228 RepID=A0AAJ7VY30_CEPCN|nr:maternal protein tudor isoform X2 [Cephus cinctus]
MTNIPQSSEINLFVTHVSADGPLLKIWGQTDRNAATCIERMILPLSEQFEQGLGRPGAQCRGLVPNVICCARFFNEGYYRARICNIRQDGMVVLQYIDYGNVDIISPEDIRLLDGIPNAVPLHTLPPLAYEFVLGHIFPVRGTWTKETLETIKILVRYSEVKAIIHSAIGTHCLIKLCYKNQDFAEYLVNRNLAVPVTLQEMFRSKFIQLPRLSGPGGPLRDPNQQNNHYVPMQCPPTRMSAPQNQGNSIHENWRTPPPPQQPVLQQKSQLSPMAEAMVFKSRVLDVGSTHEVSVSYVDDGPLKFSVQEKNTKEDLSVLMSKINNHPIEPLQEPPLPGSVCLGRYTREKIICRAVVMGVTESKCKVYYVDFGHTEVLSYSDIFQLPPQYIHPKVLSIRFTLSGLKELNVTDEMKAYFKELVTGKPLILQVRPPEGPPLIQYGDLYDNGKNVKDILKEVFKSQIPVTYKEPFRPAKGSKEIVHVSFVESYGKFFVQLESGTKSLDSIMTSLAEYAASAPTLKQTQLGVGLPCAALYKLDSNWYRAQILNVSGDKVKVLYVDYGNEDIVTATDLRVIHNDLVTNVRAQALRCSLNGYQVKPFNQELANRFESLVLEKHLSMVVVDVYPNGVLVDLFDPASSPMVSIQSLLSSSPEKNTIMSNSQQDKSFNSSRSPNPRNIRSEIKSQQQAQPAAAQQPRSKPKNTKMTREDTRDQWSNKKSQSDSWNQSNEGGDNGYDKSRSKIWKEDENEQKRRDNRYQKAGDGDRFSGPRGDRFSRDTTRNERFSRNDSNDRYERNNDSTGFGKDNRESRGSIRGGGRQFGNNSRPERNGAGSDKAWSDKDSDTSSRGSGKRGGNKGSNHGARGRRDGNQMSRNQSGKWSDGDSDRSSTKSAKYNGERASTGFKPRERRSTDGFDKSNKIGTWDASSMNNSPRKTTKPQVSQISPPNITVGAVKYCELVFVNSPSDFYVQLNPDNAELDPVMVKIASIYENGGAPLKNFKMKPGTDCIAQYSADLKWYRAVIREVEGSSATVQFVDYGNTEKIESSKIKELDAEVSRLPAQAIHCKLLAANKTEWTAEEIDAFSASIEGKSLEAEFIAQENDTYEVLLQEVVDGVSLTNYVNEVYCDGVDLNTAKESARNRGKDLGKVSRKIPPDYASIDSKWLSATICPGTTENVIVTWFTNPDNFYCQMVSKQKEFRDMMNEIQKAYVGRQPITDTLKAGSSVIAIFSDDGALYRAEVTELNKLRGHIVRYVDFGNCAMVDPRKIYPVEKKFMQLPKQAMNCSLKNIIPSNGSNWSKANEHEIDKCFDADDYECTFHEVKNGKYIISLNNKGADVGGMMVERGLASYAMTTPAAAEHACIELEIHKEDANNVAPISTTIEHIDIPERIDISLLVGQTFRAIVTSVMCVTKFYIQLPTAKALQEAVNNFMATRDPKVMRRLSCHEVCLGAGCLAYSAGLWNRAVVINCSRTTGFEVKFIDTGEIDEIPLDRMLALPRQLTVMQNQATHCSLYGGTSSIHEDEKLKEVVEGKEVIVSVEDIVNNRLLVQLYDSTGKKFKILDTDTEATIPPVTPMLVLSSSHKVMVSNATSSEHIWLQRSVDVNLEATLLEILHEHYSANGTALVPEVGSLCAALSKDGNWYRAKVAEKTEKGAVVLFIDYGNKEEIPDSNFKILEPQFYKPHQLAVQASLSVTVKGTEAEQTEILRKYLPNEELEAIFYNVHKKWVVDLIVNGEKISDKLTSLGLVAEQKKTPIIQPEVQDMVVGGRYEVFVSHADSPAQFWLQRKEEMTTIENMQAELMAAAPSYPSIEGVPEEGTLCVAMYSADNSWYRAEVLDADEDITTVRFVDYGNTDIINNKSENIKQIPDPWKSMKKYGLKCRLDVIPVGSEDWSEAACDKFDRLVTFEETPLQALVIADSVPRRVELFLGDKSIGDVLVKEGHAVMIHNEDDLIDEIIDLELDPHSAFVSHINSPSEFWVQEEKSISDLEVMSDRFMVAEMFPKVEDIKEGILCVAKYPEDEQWYRARVVSQKDNGFDVIYIDYGNSAISTEIRTIPEDLAAIPPLSRKCCLPLPEGVAKWSPESCAKFDEIAANGATIFLLEVIKEGETSEVKLTLENENIVDKLVLLCERQLPVIEERLPPLGEENSPNVVVSHVNSPSEFWTQAESCIAELEVMADRLIDAQSFLPLTTFEEGTICAGTYPEDGQWYRAKILSHSENGTEVLYMDYGNSAVTKELKILPEDIVNIPSLSKCCALRIPEDIKCWSKEACDKFVELVADGATMFQFEILDDEEPTHITLSLKGKDVVDILSSLCEKKSVPAEESNYAKEAKDTDLETGGDTITENKEDITVVQPDDETVNDIVVAAADTSEDSGIVEAVKEVDVMVTKDDEESSVSLAEISKNTDPNEDSIIPEVVQMDMTEPSAMKLVIDVAASDVISIPEEKDTFLTLVEGAQSIETTHAEVIPAVELPPELEVPVMTKNESRPSDLGQAEPTDSSTKESDATYVEVLKVVKLVPEVEELVSEVEILAVVEDESKPSDLGQVETTEPSMKGSDATDLQVPKVVELVPGVEIPAVMEDESKPSDLGQVETTETSTKGSDATDVEVPEAVELLPAEVPIVMEKVDDIPLDDVVTPKEETSVVEVIDAVKNVESIIPVSSAETLAMTDVLFKMEIPVPVMSDISKDAEMATSLSVKELTVDEIVGNMVKLAMDDRGNKLGVESSKEPEVQEIVESEEDKVDALAHISEDGAILKTPKDKKIVPGSISRGISEQEIALNLMERRSSIPQDDKIVPGSINRGAEISQDNYSESLGNGNSEKSSISTKDDIPIEYACPTTPKIEYDDKIVPGSVSRGQSPSIESERPSTPKTPHSEKLVAGVVNQAGKIEQLEEEDEDETLTITVEDNIPKILT